MIELHSQGLSEREMSERLKIPRSTINLDIRVLRQQARTNIRTYVDQQLPFEHNSCMVAVSNLLRKAWDIINDATSSDKAVANAMRLVLDCLSFKRALLMDKTDLRVIDEQIRNEAMELNSSSSLSLGSSGQRVFGDAPSYNKTAELDYDGNAQF